MKKMHRQKIFAVSCLLLSGSLSAQNESEKPFKSVSSSIPDFLQFTSRKASPEAHGTTWSDFYYKSLLEKVNSGTNEFEKRRMGKEVQSLITTTREQVMMLENTVYFVSAAALSINIGEYDFETNSYPLLVSLISKDSPEQFVYHFFKTKYGIVEAKMIPGQFCKLSQYRCLLKIEDESLAEKVSQNKTEIVRVVDYAVVSLAKSSYLRPSATQSVEACLDIQATFNEDGIGWLNRIVETSLHEKYDFIAGESYVVTSDEQQEPDGLTVENRKVSPVGDVTTVAAVDRASAELVSKNYQERISRTESEFQKEILKKERKTRLANLGFSAPVMDEVIVDSGLEGANVQPGTGGTSEEPGVGEANVESRSKTLAEYSVRLSASDHYNSRGVKLTSAAGILRQDRANYYKFNKRDREDQPGWGETITERADFTDAAVEGLSEKSTLNAILRGTPLVSVLIVEDRDSGEVSIRVDLLKK